MMNGATVKRVLVIDDEPAARALICEYLKMGGFRADTADTIAGAVELIGGADHLLARRVELKSVGTGVWALNVPVNR